MLSQKFLAIKSRDDVGAFVGVDWNAKLGLMLYGGPMRRLYRTFDIAKRGGGTRQISAPSKPLYEIQRRVHDALSEIYRPPFSVNGFVKSRGIVRNGISHVGAEAVFAIDLQDFFPSVNFGRVRGLFMAKPFRFSPEVASLLAHICCVDGALPQGAPTSPIVSNMVCRKLDKQLAAIARVRGCTYSRYADDLAFSGRLASVERLMQELTPARPSAHLVSAITAAGFKVNESKSRLLTQRDAMIVTGLVTNVRLNVRRSRIRRLRSFLRWIERDGYQVADERYVALKASGKIPGARAHSIERFLLGSLRHLQDVRGRYDPLVQAYQQRCNAAFPAGFQFRITPDPAAIGQNCYVVESTIVEKNEATGAFVRGPVQGTAFAVSNRILVSCSHCIGTETEIFLPGSTQVRTRAWLVGRDSDADIAIIRANSDLVGTGLKLAMAAVSQVGDEVTAYGFPKYSPGATVAVNSAKIVQFYRYFGRGRLRISSPIVSGNSGGPVLDAKGLAIGMAATGMQSFHSSPDDNDYGVVMLESIISLLKKHRDVLVRSDPSFRIV